MAEALAPLRIKLEMIIELLAKLSYRDLELPPRREIEIEASRVSWESPQPLSLAAWLRIRMYFHPTFREPIVIFGKVTSSNRSVAGAAYLVHADLAEMSECSRGELSHLAFLSQRRQRARRTK